MIGPRGAAALMIAGLAVGCAHPPGPVDLSGAWPAQPGGYADANRAWTRHATLSADFTLLLEVYATLRAPPWLAARAAHEARQRGADAAPLVAAAQERADREVEVVLAVTTHDRAENDLERGDRATWHLALVDDAGTEIAPIAVERDRRPPAVVRAELPAFDDFAVAYRARFPRTPALLGPGVRRVALRVWSSRGAVTLRWDAR